MLPEVWGGTYSEDPPLFSSERELYRFRGAARLDLCPLPQVLKSRFRPLLTWLQSIRQEPTEHSLARGDNLSDKTPAFPPHRTRLSPIFRGLAGVFRSAANFESPLNRAPQRLAWLGVLARSQIRNPSVLHRRANSEEMGAPLLPTSPVSRPRPHPSPGGSVINAVPRCTVSASRREWLNCPRVRQ